MCITRHRHHLFAYLNLASAHIIQNKEREAIEAAKLKAKQLDVQRREQAKKQAMQTLRGQTMGGASYQGLTGGYGGPGMGAIGGTYGSAGGAPRAGGAPAPSFGGTPSLGARPDAAT